MNMTRRQFLASMGGAGLLYAFRFPTKTGAQTGPFDPIPGDEPVTCKPLSADIDYTNWIAFGPDNKVTVFTGRTELGQGLKTVITAFVTQALEIPQDHLTVIQGDTDLCPDDGPTVGSAATRYVGLEFWWACEKIRTDLVKRASRSLGIPAGELEFKTGGIGRKGNPRTLISASALGSGETVLLTLEPNPTPTARQYVDRGIANVNGEKIVTGELKYTGDLEIPGMLYAGWHSPPYHKTISRLRSADLHAARKLPGVKMVEVVRGRVAAVAERRTDVLKALALVETDWSTPDRPEQLQVEQEARAGAQLLDVKEEIGDVNAGLAESDLVISETYTTQYITHAQIETDTALATPEDTGGRVTVHVASQYPHLAKQLIAKYLSRPLSEVRVIAMPAGGAFGGKIGNFVNREAAHLAESVNAPVKLLYSRKDQFQLMSYFKPASIIDVTTGVNTDGTIVARKIDFYQDDAEGTTEVYSIPHVSTNAYVATFPFGRTVTRGTSYVQSCFAIESNMDMLAARLNMDPVEFRKKNAAFPVYADLLDTCAEMIGYQSVQLDNDEGIGFAILRHGGSQFEATAARVAVDRVTGKINIKHICTALDIGTVVNINTATACIRGGITWGIGFALSEEVMLNGHRTETGYLSQYHIPRFSDIPPIEIAFQDNHHPPGTVRGCGEMPVIPTIGAIANAVYNAVGIRFYSTPMTPDRVKKALQNAQQDRRP